MTYAQKIYQIWHSRYVCQNVPNVTTRKCCIQLHKRKFFKRNLCASSENNESLKKKITTCKRKVTPQTLVRLCVIPTLKNRDLLILQSFMLRMTRTPQLRLSIKLIE